MLEVINFIVTVFEIPVGGMGTPLSKWHCCQNPQSLPLEFLWYLLYVLADYEFVSQLNHLNCWSNWLSGPAYCFSWDWCFLGVKINNDLNQQYNIETLLVGSRHHVSSLDFNIVCFSYWGGSHYSCICACLHHFCSFNSLLCCLLPFHLIYVILSRPSCVLEFYPFGIP